MNFYGTWRLMTGLIMVSSLRMCLTAHTHFLYIFSDGESACPEDMYSPYLDGGFRRMKWRQPCLRGYTTLVGYGFVAREIPHIISPALLCRSFARAYATYFLRCLCDGRAL